MCVWPFQTFFTTLTQYVYIQMWKNNSEYYVLHKRFSARESLRADFMIFFNSLENFNSKSSIESSTFTVLGPSQCEQIFVISMF